MGGPGPKPPVQAAPVATPDAVAVLKVIENALENDFMEIDIFGKIGEAVARPGLEKKYPLPTKAGLPGFDRYHLAGPNATGAEEGIVYASRQFNIGKTARIENIMRNARQYAKANGGEAYIRVRAIVKSWKDVDGVNIRVLKEIEWTIEFRLAGSDKIVKLVDAERYLLKPPQGEPGMWAKYVPKRLAGAKPPGAALRAVGKGGSVVAMAIPVVAGIVHTPAVEKRVEKQAKKEGYVSFNSPSGEGLLYDIGAWLIDPFKDAEFSVGMDKRFDVAVWRKRLTEVARQKKTGETLEIEWDVGTSERDVFGRQVIESRKITYQKLPDGAWKAIKGDDKGAPDFNFILSADVTDGEVMSHLFSDPTHA